MQAFPIYIGKELQGVEGPSYTRYQGVSLGLLPPMHPLRLLVSGNRRVTVRVTVVPPCVTNASAAFALQQHHVGSIRRRLR